MVAKPADSPRWTPPGWLNRAMTLTLKTPGLDRIVGKSTALVTFTGRRSGRPITTPLSYVQVDDRILLSGHRARQWWRNLVVNPRVEIRLAGRVRRGVASVMDDPDNAVADFVAYVKAQPTVAKINEIPIEGGVVDLRAAREVLAYTVLVSVKLEEDER